MTKKTRKKKAQPLEGFMQSGIIFIGDPSYMQGDLSQPGSEALECPENPFQNWGKFTESLNHADKSLPFPGAISDDSYGRGVAVQTRLSGGKFEVKKKFDKVTGKLLQITIKFNE